VAAALPGWQSHRSLGVSTLGRPAVVGVAVAVATVGVVGAGARVLLGDDLVGLVVTATLGGVAYVAALGALRAELHLDALWNGVRRRS